MPIEQDPYKWDDRFIGLAKHISAWSKDPSTQVGAVIVDKHNRIISSGFNGFPRKIHDNERLSNRKDKYEIIIHAERNALLFANQDVTDCTIYTYPFPPCAQCTILIIQAGISG